MIVLTQVLFLTFSVVVAVDLEAVRPQCQHVVFNSNTTFTTWIPPPCAGGPLDFRTNGYNISSVCVNLKFSSNRWKPLNKLTPDERACYESKQSMSSKDAGCLWVDDFANWLRTSSNFKQKYGSLYVEHLINFYRVLMCEYHTYCEYSVKFLLAHFMTRRVYYGLYTLTDPLISPGYQTSSEVMMPGEFLPNTVRWLGDSIQILGVAWLTLVGNIFNALVLHRVLQEGNATFVFQFTDICVDMLVSLMYIMYFFLHGYVATFPDGCSPLFTMWNALYSSLAALAQVFQSLLVIDRFFYIVCLWNDYQRLMTRRIAICITLTLSAVCIGTSYANVILAAASAPVNVIGFLLWLLQIVLTVAIVAKLWQMHRFRKIAVNGAQAPKKQTASLFGTVFLNIFTSSVSILYNTCNYLYCVTNPENCLKRPVWLVSLWSLVYMQSWLDMLNCAGFVWHLILFKSYRTAARTLLRSLLCRRSASIVPLVKVTKSKNTHVTVPTDLRDGERKYKRSTNSSVSQR